MLGPLVFVGLLLCPSPHGMSAPAWSVAAVTALTRASPF